MTARRRLALTLTEALEATVRDAADRELLLAGLNLAKLGRYAGFCSGWAGRVVDQRYPDKTLARVWAWTEQRMLLRLDAAYWEQVDLIAAKRRAES